MIHLPCFLAPTLLLRSHTDLDSLVASDDPTPHVVTLHSIGPYTRTHAHNTQLPLTLFLCTSFPSSELHTVFSCKMGCHTIHPLSQTLYPRVINACRLILIQYALRTANILHVHLHKCLIRMLICFSRLTHLRAEAYVHISLVVRTLTDIKHPECLLLKTKSKPAFRLLPNTKF